MARRFLALLLPFTLLLIPGPVGEAAAPPAGAGKGRPARVDLSGDPLPPRAVSRLGSLRFLHRDFVTAAAFSPDGRRFASSAVGGNVVVWEWPSGKRLHTLPARLDWSASPHLLFSPDGRYLAVHAFQKLGVWDLTSGEAVLEGTATQPPTFSADGKRLAWLEDDRTVRAWDLAAGKDLPKHARRHPALALGYGKGGRLVLAEWRKGVLSLRDPATEKQLHGADLGKGLPLWAEFSRDGSCLAYLTTTSGVTALDVRTGKELGRLPKVPEGYHPSALSPDGKALLLRARKNSALQIWDLKKGKKTCTVGTRAGEGGVRLGAFSPDGKLLAVGGTNHPHGASFWDTKTGKRVEIPAGHRSEVIGLTFSPDGKEVATCAPIRGDPTVRIWDPETGRLLRSFEAHTWGTWQVAYTPSGRELVTCGMWDEEQLCVWDARRLTKLRVMKGHTYGATDLVVSPEGGRVASVGKGSNPHDGAVWDLKTGERLHAHPDLGGTVERVAFTPGGRTLAVCTEGELRFWELASPKGAVGRRLGGRPFPPAGLSPDARVVLATNPHKKASRLVEILTGKEVGPVAEGVKVSSFSFSDDGRTLALGDADGMIRLFDLPSRKECLAFRAYSTGVYRLTSSPDGKRLASVGGGIESATALVWDVAAKMNRPLPRTKAGPKEVEAWSAALGHDDPAVAYPAVWALVGAPKEAVRALRAEVRKAKPTPLNVAKLIADLDDDEFEVREKAEQTLVRAGALGVREMEAALAGKPSPEQRRRLQRILGKVRSRALPREVLFAARAVLVLEQIGGAEPQALLCEMAAGPAGTRLAQEAQLALQRLAQKRTAAR